MAGRIIQQIRLEENMRKREIKQQAASLKWFEENYQSVYLDPFRPANITPKKTAELYNRIKEIRRLEFEREKENKRKDEEEKVEFKRSLMAFQEQFPQRYSEEKGVMYPVPDHIRMLLYNGVSQAGEGRYLYLKVRNALAPYQKFYRKVTTTHTYGWKVEERAERPVKDHNRLSVIKGSFYRRFGAIRPDSTRKNLPFSAGLMQPENIKAL